MFDKLVKYADTFQKLARLEKQAGILENMAARVLWSTMPWEVQMQNPVALLSLLPGAKELLHYGREAVLDEAEKHTDEVDKLRMVQDPVAFFNTASQMFLSGNWGSLFGGKNWSDISLGYARLAEAIKRIDASGNKYEERNKALNEMVAYMNIIDATMHNSGLLIDKLLDIEANEKGIFDLDRREQMFNNVLKVMDAKELQEPKDVVSVVLPVVKTMPERFMPFKDWASSYYQQAHQPKNVPDQLRIVRFQKLLKEAEQTIRLGHQTQDQRELDLSIDILMQIAEEVGNKKAKEELRLLYKKGPEALPHLNRFMEMLKQEVLSVMPGLLS